MKKISLCISLIASLLALSSCSITKPNFNPGNDNTSNNEDTNQNNPNNNDNTDGDDSTSPNNPDIGDGDNSNPDIGEGDTEGNTDPDTGGDNSNPDVDNGNTSPDTGGDIEGNTEPDNGNGDNEGTDVPEVVGPTIEDSWSTEKKANTMLEFALNKDKEYKGSYTIVDYRYIPNSSFDGNDNYYFYYSYNEEKDEYIDYQPPINLYCQTVKDDSLNKYVTYRLNGSEFNYYPYNCNVKNFKNKTLFDYLFDGLIAQTSMPTNANDLIEILNPSYSHEVFNNYYDSLKPTASYEFKDGVATIYLNHIKSSLYRRDNIDYSITCDKFGITYVKKIVRDDYFSTTENSTISFYKEYKNDLFTYKDAKSMFPKQIACDTNYKILHLKYGDFYDQDIAYYIEGVYVYEEPIFNNLPEGLEIKFYTDHKKQNEIDIKTYYFDNEVNYLYIDFIFDESKTLIFEYPDDRPISFNLVDPTTFKVDSRYNYRVNFTSNGISDDDISLKPNYIYSISYYLKDYEMPTFNYNYEHLNSLFEKFVQNYEKVGYINFSSDLEFSDTTRPSHRKTYGKFNPTKNEYYKQTLIQNVTCKERTSITTFENNVLDEYSVDSIKGDMHNKSLVEIDDINQYKNDFLQDLITERFNLNFTSKTLDGVLSSFVNLDKESNLLLQPNNTNYRSNGLRSSYFYNDINNLKVSTFINLEIKDYFILELIDVSISDENGFKYNYRITLHFSLRDTIEFYYFDDLIDESLR